MKTKIIIAFLLIISLQLLILAPVLAQDDQPSIPQEEIQKLAEALSELNAIFVEYQKWFMTLTPEEQQKATEKLLEEFGKINSEIERDLKK